MIGFYQISRLWSVKGTLRWSFTIQVNKNSHGYLLLFSRTVNIKLYRMTWHTSTCGITATGLLYRLTLLKFYLFLCLALDSIVVLWPAHHAWMGVTVTNIISSVGHPRSDLVRLLMMDGIVHIQGIGVVLEVPPDSANLARKGLMSWVDNIVWVMNWFSFIRRYIMFILHLWWHCQRINCNIAFLYVIYK
jgi:hypothetical protein